MNLRLFFLLQALSPLKMKLSNDQTGKVNDNMFQNVK